MLLRPTKMPNGTTQLSMTNAVHRNTSVKPVICFSSVIRIRPAASRSELTTRAGLNLLYFSQLSINLGECGGATARQRMWPGL
jgi:hypothetical protein